MLDAVSGVLRRVADDLENLSGRVAERNKTDIYGNPLPDVPQDGDSNPAAEPDVTQDECGSEECAPVRVCRRSVRTKPGQYNEAPHPTAQPDVKPSRREPAHRRKWNPDSRRTLMRQYMREYRGTGRINERKPHTGG